MRYIILDKYHTYEDFGLELIEQEIDTPKIKSNFVEVPGRDGTLDLSAAFGEPVYEDRNARFKFVCMNGNRIDREELFNRIKSLLSGKRINIIQEDNKDFYFIGRNLSISTENLVSHGFIEFEYRCEPWRKAVNETKRTFTVTEVAKKQYLNNNGGKIVFPNISVDGTVQLKYGQYTHDLETGNYKFTSLKLPYGNTEIELSGTGTIDFTYREAVL